MGLSEGLHALGTCFARIGYYAHALEHLGQAVSLCREVGDRYVGLTSAYTLDIHMCVCMIGFALQKSQR